VSALLVPTYWESVKWKEAVHFFQRDTVMLDHGFCAENVFKASPYLDGACSEQAQVLPCYTSAHK